MVTIELTTSTNAVISYPLLSSTSNPFEVILTNGINATSKGTFYYKNGSTQVDGLNDSLPIGWYSTRYDQTMIGYIILNIDWTNTLIASIPNYKSNTVLTKVSHFNSSHKYPVKELYITWTYYSNKSAYNAEVYPKLIGALTKPNVQFNCTGGVITNSDKTITFSGLNTTPNVGDYIKFYNSPSGVIYGEGLYTDSEYKVLYVSGNSVTCELLFDTSLSYNGSDLILEKLGAGYTLETYDNINYYARMTSTNVCEYKGITLEMYSPTNANNTTGLNVKYTSDIYGGSATTFIDSTSGNIFTHRNTTNGTIDTVKIIASNIGIHILTPYNTTPEYYYAYFGRVKSGSNFINNNIGGIFFSPLGNVSNFSSIPQYNLSTTSTYTGAPSTAYVTGLGFVERNDTLMNSISTSNSYMGALLRMNQYAPFIKVDTTITLDNNIIGEIPALNFGITLPPTNNSVIIDNKGISWTGYYIRCYNDLNWYITTDVRGFYGD